MYLIDKDGHIRYVHIGEGNYAETEQAINQLLTEQ
jgi:peroxiredoxin